VWTDEISKEMWILLDCIMGFIVWVMHLLNIITKSLMIILIAVLAATIIAIFMGILNPRKNELRN